MNLTKKLPDSLNCLEKERKKKQQQKKKEQSLKVMLLAAVEIHKFSLSADLIPYFHEFPMKSTVYHSLLSANSCFYPPIILMTSFFFFSHR